MKRLFSAFTIAVALATAPGAQAAELLWAGVLEDADGLVDRPVSAIFTVKDVADAVVLTQTEASLLVVDGTFVVALDVPDEDELSLEVVINGTALEPAAPLPTTWARAVVADAAERADVAELANAVGTVTSPLTTTGLSTAGFSVSQLVGFPESFLDGDDGLDFVGGATMSFTGGVVAVRAGTLQASHVSGDFVNADVADGTIQTADFADNGINATDLSAIPTTKIASSTFTSRHFAGNAIDVFVVNENGCSEPLNSLQTDDTCSFTSTTNCATTVGGMPATGKLVCAAARTGGNGDCLLVSSSRCPVPLIGRLVLP